MTETCPVCGWAVVDTDHIPENPSSEHGPDAPGTYYIHKKESTGNGKIRQEGCSEYKNGETDAWTPPEVN